MKKIKILTFHWTVNFGGLLQAYALQEKLKSFGYETEFINYHNKKELSSVSSRKRRVLQFVWDKVAKIFFGRRKRAVITQKFRDEHLNISKIKYSSFEQLSNIEKEERAYAYIVGSDQVWNPDLTGNPNAYLFSFLSHKCKKIAYAASFGKASLPKGSQTVFRRELKEFSSLSVREEDGATLMKSLFGIKPEIVMDPVFLLGKDRWDIIVTERLIDEDYVLCYYMNSADKSIHEGIKNIAEHLSKKHNIKVINIGKKEFERCKFWENNLFDIGPREFISLIKNSKYVVTNSFHATAFSIIYNIPFFIPVNYAEISRNRLSNRIENLVKAISCDDRIISCPIDRTNTEMKICGLEKMDFANANKKVEVLVEKSNEFITTSL